MSAERNSEHEKGANAHAASANVSEEGIMCFRPSGCVLSATSSTSQKDEPGSLGPFSNSWRALRAMPGINHVASRIRGFFSPASSDEREAGERTSGGAAVDGIVVMPLLTAAVEGKVLRPLLAVAGPSLPSMMKVRRIPVLRVPATPLSTEGASKWSTRKTFHVFL